MTTPEKLKKAARDVGELLEVLRYARGNKPPGYFTWSERMAIHQYRSAWLRIFEKLEDYNLKDGVPDAVYAILETNEPHLSPDLQRKIKDVTGWLEIKRSHHLM